MAGETPIGDGTDLGVIGAIRTGDGEIPTGVGTLLIGVQDFMVGMPGDGTTVGITLGTILLTMEVIIIHTTITTTDMLTTITAEEAIRIITAEEVAGGTIRTGEVATTDLNTIADPIIHATIDLIIEPTPVL